MMSEKTDSYSVSRHLRKRFYNATVSKAYQQGFTETEVSKILSVNRVVFLEKITQIVEHSPDPFLCHMFLSEPHQCRNMESAEDIFGDWVHDITKDPNTLHSAIEIYMDFMADRVYSEKQRTEEGS